MTGFIPLTIRKRNGQPKIVPPAAMAPDTVIVDPHVLKAIAKAWNWRRKLEAGAVTTFEDVACGIAQGDVNGGGYVVGDASLVGV